MLESILGQKQADKLKYAIASRIVYVPSCQNARLYLRNQTVIAEFDRLCKERNDLPVTKIATILGRKFQLTARQIFNIVN